MIRKTNLLDFLHNLACCPVVNLPKQSVKEISSTSGEETEKRMRNIMADLREE